MKNTIINRQKEKNKAFLNIVELLSIKSQTNSTITETDIQRRNDIKKSQKNWTHSNSEINSNVCDKCL